MAYTKLDGGITESTIWQAPDATRLVWITMLARADQNGYVGASMPGLAGLARVSLQACIEAVSTLEAPDEWSRTKEHDGRRIAPADGGWVLLNHAKYRAMQNADDRRERSRLAMAELRNRRKHELTVNHSYQSCKKLTQAEAEAEAKEIDKLSLVSSLPGEGKDAKGLPDCPHKAILALWAEVLPHVPQHLQSQWKGTRATNLRARWRETAVEKSWSDEAQGLAWFRKFFGYVGQSRFLMGRIPPTNGHRQFELELAWLVNPTNWAKVHEGKYHSQEAA